MFFALCPGPFFSAEDLYEPLMSFASYCSLLALALVAYVKWADARRRRLAKRYALGLNNG